MKMFRVKVSFGVSDQVQITGGTAMGDAPQITSKQIFLLGTFICVLTCCCMFMYMDVNLLEVTRNMLTNQYNYEQNNEILTKSPNIEPDCAAVKANNEPVGHPLLVDVTETQLMGWTSKGVIDSSTRFKYSKPIHKILWYNLPAWLPVGRITEHAKTCPFNNCEHTVNKSISNSSSAIVFCMSDGAALKRSPLSAHERNANQVWIYFGLESPATQERIYKGSIPSWVNSFNWSMTYQLDSDIVFPYGVLKTKQFVENRNFSEIFRRKSKWAAWLVSKCGVPSLRDTFVDKLKKHGLPVDIFGHCGKRLTADPEETISGEYKFYLSFENSMCEDYVTEKFFKYFRYDTILVVRGGADYKKLLPKHTFIDTADFKSFESLVSYLTLVWNNETQYTTYLRNKARYTSTDTNLPFCALCTKLNHVDIYKKTYIQIPKNLHKCYTPGDIDLLDN